MTNAIDTPSSLPGIGGGTILAPSAPSAPNTQLTATGASPGSKTYLDYLTGGWPIVVGFGIGILLGQTQFGVLVAGVIGVGLIFQLDKLVTGKR